MKQDEDREQVPVAAAAVCFTNTEDILIKKLSQLNDSKQLTEKKRDELYSIIIENTVYEVVFGTVDEIEKNNILKTSLNCMKKPVLQ